VSFSIVHLSDPHFGGVADLELIEGVETLVPDLEPRVIVVAGDLSQRARHGEFQAARQFVRELERTAPDVARVTRDAYANAPSISIDYALMEKASRVVAVRGEFGWSDVGSWAAVARLSKQGSARLIAEEASNIFAVATSGRPVMAIGVDNIAIVEADEGILVLDLEKAELLSKVVKRLG